MNKHIRNKVLHWFVTLTCICKWRSDKHNQQSPRRIVSKRKLSSSEESDRGNYDQYDSPMCSLVPISNPVHFDQHKYIRQMRINRIGIFYSRQDLNTMVFVKYFNEGTSRK